jgi:arginine decarboxylase
VKKELSLTETRTENTWTIEDSEELYRIEYWGDPYFSINAAGHITVSPQGDRGGALDLFDLITSLRQRNLELPLLIRFSDILEDRLERLTSAFSRAIARYSYSGHYQGVFPVKCNQQRHVVESLVKYGSRHQFGLEAGSKPELLIALATLNSPGSLILCNGYKDADYIETALLASRMSQQTVIILEQVEELDLALAASKKLGIKPWLGVRAKLNIKSSGHWAKTVGDGAKFGLTVPEIVECVEKLRDAGMLDCLRLLHFHIGSQISAISTIKEALREACQVYVELVKMGASMGYLDVGGGLAVDYDGTKSNSHASKNYNIQNYANDVVAAVKDACASRDVPQPVLVSESGRALASHMTVLVFDVLGVSEMTRTQPKAPSDDDHLIVKNLFETLDHITPENLQETWHDAKQFKKEAISLFGHGYLSLSQRAKAERLFWQICRILQKQFREMEEPPDDLEELDRVLASMYYVNLSIFQSVPDTWAMDQLFPIMPIHRLNEEPTERGTLADLTCDSDGKLDRFIDPREDHKTLLELHPLVPSKDPSRRFEPYCLGLFLSGAYQEILGSLHNLFGDVNAVHIKMTPNGYQVEHVVKGDTMREVLSYVSYDVDDLEENIRQRTERAIESGRMTLQESQLLLQGFEAGLRRYTYLMG